MTYKSVDKEKIKITVICALHRYKQKQPKALEYNMPATRQNQVGL